MHPSANSQALHRFKPIGADVSEYWDELDGLARYLCEDAEDAHLIRALTPPDDELGGVSVRATMRIWLHHITAGEIRRVRPLDRPGWVDKYLDSVVVGHLAGDLLDPAEMAEEMEMRSMVLEAIPALPANYLIALLLREGRGTSVKDIAKTMKLSTASVRSVLYRARQSIRHRLIA
jgi:RNA polymerase sigma factor (sigma-70 family)